MGFAPGVDRVLMMMIALITIKRGLVPFIEGLCANIYYFGFEIIDGVTRHCTDSHCKRTSSSSRVHEKRASLEIKQFYTSTCLHVPYPQRVQTIPITALPQPYLITLGSEKGPQGDRGGTAWVKETFAPLKRQYLGSLLCFYVVVTVEDARLWRARRVPW